MVLKSPFTASRADESRAIATLVLAFSADPIVRWILPDAEAYLSHFPDLVRHFGGNAFDAGTAFCSDDMGGVALWLPAGVHPDYEAMSDWSSALWTQAFARSSRA